MPTKYIINTYKAPGRHGTALLAVLLLIALSFSSCKKDGLYEGTPYALRVFNGIDGAVNLYGNYNGDRPTIFATAIAIQNRRTSLNSFFVEENINSSYFAVPDTMAKDQPVFKQDFNLASSKVNTLYLMGDKSNVDHLFVPLNFKRYTDGDSVTFITIVNISNDQPVNVNIKGRPSGSLVSQLAYKKVSEVIELPVGVSNPVYEIEFRDAVSDGVLTTFMLDNANPHVGYYNTYLNKSTSIVLVGKRGQAGVNKMEAVRISHD